MVRSTPHGFGGLSRARLFEVLEPARAGDAVSRAFDIGLITLVSLNVLALIAETIKGAYDLAPLAFQHFETFSLIVFATEYVARLWSCTASEEYREPLAGRFRFALRPLVVFDFLAILPLFLPFLGMDLRFLRIMRLLRVFRVAKVARYSAALQTVGRVLASKKTELVVALSVLALLLVLSSSLIYVAEHRAQPERFTDIPTAMWWCLSKITRLGLTDLGPVTGPGKAITALISILGVAVIALPTAILSAGLIEEFRKSKLALCPHCGKALPGSGDRS